MLITSVCLLQGTCRQIAVTPLEFSCSVCRSMLRDASVGPRVKQYHSGFILNPTCVAPKTTLQKARSIQAHRVNRMDFIPRVLASHGPTVVVGPSLKSTPLDFCLQNSSFAVNISMESRPSLSHFQTTQVVGQDALRAAFRLDVRDILCHWAAQD